MLPFKQNEGRLAYIERCLLDPDLIKKFPDDSTRFAKAAYHFDNAHDMGDYTLSGKIEKVDVEQKIAYGWFSVIEENGEVVVDHHGDTIDEDTLVQAAHGFILEYRAGKIMHQGKKIADVVESMVFTKDVQKALGIDLGKVGWFGAMKFRDDETWARVKSGEFSEFSIGGHATRTEI